MIIYVLNVKNKTPIFTQEDRIRILKSLKCVDDAVLMSVEEVADKLKFYNKIKFAIFW